SGESTTDDDAATSPAVSKCKVSKAWSTVTKEAGGISATSIERTKELQNEVTKSMISAHDTVAVKLDEDLFIFKSQPGQAEGHYHSSRQSNSFYNQKEECKEQVLLQSGSGCCSVINRSFNKPDLSGIVTLAKRFLYQLGRRALPCF
ncbi:hypothetical protein RhiirA5_434341, partial [Rhizophagus irregularis]